jgi:N-acetylglucosamine-6-phosphate deacetylase
MLLERGINHYGLSLADTVTMLTSTPASILGLGDRGAIRDGYVADVVIFDSEWHVKHVLLGGKQYV